MDYINAFWVGGLICALVQILMEKTKLMPGRIMVLLVCTGAVLSAIGLYEPFQEFAGAGAGKFLEGFVQAYGAEHGPCTYKKNHDTAGHELCFFHEYLDEGADKASHPECINIIHFNNPPTGFAEQMRVL